LVTGGLIALIGLVIAAPAFAQLVSPARAGLVHYAEGGVILNGQHLVGRASQFPQMEEDDSLATRGGRAELLLAPGVILRLGYDTTIRLLSGDITDSRVELVSGEVLLETVELWQIKQVTMVLGDTAISTSRSGRYNLVTNPPRVRVIRGKAAVVSGVHRYEVNKGSEVLFGETLLSRKFDPRVANPLVLWSGQRSRLLTSARVRELARRHPGVFRAF
jgi:hypothetical protein